MRDAPAPCAMRHAPAPAPCALRHARCARAARLALTLSLSSLFSTTPAFTQSPDPAPAVKIVCERIQQPGRVRCEVEVRVPASSTASAIRWGDIEIVQVPAFVVPLKGRIGPRDATTREPELWRWAFALAAREKGSGDVSARVRVVMCKAERCATRVVPVSAHVAVGDGDGS